jgi:hypothetical protein
MNQKQVEALARRSGIEPTYHAASGTVQIDGHRWDRWNELRKLPDPKPLVIWQVSGLDGFSRVYEGA